MNLRVTQKKFVIKDKGIIIGLSRKWAVYRNILCERILGMYLKKMLEMSAKNEASVFLEDLEDKSHELLTVRQLEKIITAPKNPDFDLERLL